MAKQNTELALDTFETQDVNKREVYFDRNFDGRDSFISYYNQYKLIKDLSPVPETILEIGPGTKVLNNYLRGMRFGSTTCDFDAKLKPDYLADVRNLNIIPEQSFDCAVAFEVLEHIPFQDVPLALGELHRVTKDKGYVIISLPYTTINIGGVVKLIPYVRPFKFLLRLSELFFIKHKFDGAHHWEMGKKNYSRKTIRQTLLENKFSIVKEFSDELNPYHYFFVLQKE